MDAALLGTMAVSFAKMLADSGVELIQYRDKRSASRTLFETSQQLVLALQPRVRVVVNDRADVAAIVGAGGVHVGQEDLPVEQARAICGPHMWVGVSTHTLEQVALAQTTSANYIAIGPIFSTRTKEKPDPVVGVEFIRAARQLTHKPLVAIGGITMETAGAVYQAGADCLAVARDLITADDPGGRARAYLELAARVARENQPQEAPGG